ncbi:MAG: precorrin-6y C5,15-methyltransferase (decarboxylating) subunit CbiE [Rhodospirillales bacterium]|nr:MAG: precorrin-6y C5,15-methyltransferase (decarboxylating) subunit CbiE [Rhodospirillales bacterium]
MSGWINIVGIGEDGLDGLSAAARALVDTAEVLAGGARHLAMIPDNHAAERLVWRPRFLDSLKDLTTHRGRRVTVLASGDPMHYGVGATLARELPEMIAAVLPAPGAFSLAAARLRWPLQEVTCLSLHGRSAETFYLHVVPGARLLILSEDGHTPAQVAALLTSRGFGASRLTVLEHMAGPRESSHDGLAREWGDGPAADLNTIAVTCIASPGAAVMPRVPGLPDDAFEHDGKMTKREVRAATLAALAPFPGQLLWDVGAGCGSVGIEWMRAGGRAIGVESDADRAAMAARNAAALGVPGLEIVIGAAPEALSGLAAPDAVFVGGGLAAHGVFEACWDALDSGGRLVANTVTIEGERRLADLHRAHGGDVVRIAISRLAPVGALHGWKPMMPITQWRGVKP